MFDRLFASIKRPYFKNLNNLDTLTFDLTGSRLTIQLRTSENKLKSTTKRY